MFCPKCGVENDEESEFCKKCGSPLNKDTIKENHSMAYQDASSKINKATESKKSSKFAENKVLIIAIITIIVVAGCVAGYILLQPHYKEINVIGISMEVPESDYNVTINSQITNTYSDEENHVMVYGLDTTHAGLADLIGEGIVYAGIRDVFINTSTPVKVDNITIYEYTNGTFSYTTYFGHKNIFIVTKDEDTLIHIVKSLNPDGNASTSRQKSI